ncbi:hypothetical protein JW979_05990 [bacterium]|nr:hypothetical protein [candidate division CSSED10-310 bacterium]
MTRKKIVAEPKQKASPGIDIEQNYHVESWTNEQLKQTLIESLKLQQVLKRKIERKPAKPESQHVYRPRYLDVLTRINIMIDVCLTRIASSSRVPGKDSIGAVDALFVALSATLFVLDSKLLKCFSLDIPAEDIIQKKFLRILNIDAYTSNKKGYGFLVTADKNLIRDECRSRDRIVNIEEDPADVRLDDIIESEAPYLMIPRSTLPSARRAENLMMMEQFLEALNIIDRKVIVLWMKGYSYKEIGLMCQMRYTKVQYRIADILFGLRNNYVRWLLKEFNDDEKRILFELIKGKTPSAISQLCRVDEAVIEVTKQKAEEFVRFSLRDFEKENRRNFELWWMGYTLESIAERNGLDLEIIREQIESVKRLLQEAYLKFFTAEGK